MAKRYEGVFPALITPFAGGPLGDVVDTEAFEHNIRAFNRYNFSGYLVLGSTGECVSMSDTEALGLVETARRAAAPGRLVIAGTGRESTKLAIDFTNAAAGLGIDAALVRPPAYFKSRMSREALRRHYLAVADEAKVPIIIYNIPQNTGVVIEPALIVELAAHPNIAGLKESSGSIAYLEEIIRRLPNDFSYLVGSGYMILPALVMGACGAILAVANAAPAHCIAIHDLFRQGRVEEAARLQLDIVPLNKAVMETYGIPGLKYAAGLIGQRGGLVRPPLLPLDEKGPAEIEELMKTLPRVEN